MRYICYILVRRHNADIKNKYKRYNIQINLRVSDPHGAGDTLEAPCLAVVGPEGYTTLHPHIRMCVDTSRRQVRITSTPLAATLPPLSAILAGKSNRPQGYWKDMYIEKLETHPAKVAVRDDGRCDRLFLYLLFA